MPVVMAGGLSPAEQPAPIAVAATKRVILGPDNLEIGNITLTDESNPVVNALQMGVDGPGTLKDQHLSSADNTTTGRGASITLNPGAAAGTDQNGADLRLGSGIHTGAGNSGAIAVMLSAGGQGAGTTERIQRDVAYFVDSGGVPVFEPATNLSTLLGAAALRWLWGYIFQVKTSIVEFDAAIAAASAPNNSIFRDSADNILKQKNNAGVVSAI